MNQAPFSFDLSIYEVFAFLGIGGTIVLNSREQTADPEGYLTRLGRERISVWISTPSFARQQLLSKQFDGTHLPDLKVFLFCGEVLPHSLVKRLRERFPLAQVLNTYGPTEATVATTWMFIDDDILAKFDPLPVGRAKPDSVVRIAGSGEIEILGPHVMLGYLNRPELNDEKLFEESGQRGFRTGDVGEMGEDGLLFCRGRRDDQIKLNGYRIELQEIDKALQRLPGVSGSAVVPLRRPDGAVARLVAYVTMPSHTAPATDWKERLAASLPPYMVPSELLLAADLPVSTNGKIDRKALEQSYLAQSRN
jgi:D-alanine--poly(phosphoribitol) ligase subunit 1